MSTQLTGNIVYNQVDAGAWPAQAVGYRTLYPDAMMCPMWTGTDLAGRPVCENSFYTKRAGCNSALDRIKVEDSLRPRYAEFLWDARGIQGVGADYGSNEQSAVHTLTQDLVNTRRKAIGLQNGNFGVVSPTQYQYGLSGTYNEAASNAFQNLGQDAMAAGAQNRRNAQNLTIGANMPMQNGSMNMLGNPNTVSNPGAGGSGELRPNLGPGGTPGQSRPNGFGPRPTPAVLPRPNGYGPTPTPAVLPRPNGYGPTPTPTNLRPNYPVMPVIPNHPVMPDGPTIHPTGFGIKCNPNTTECTGAWRDDMFVPRNPTTYQNYIQAKDYNHYNGQYI